MGVRVQVAHARAPAGRARCERPFGALPPRCRGRLVFAAEEQMAAPQPIGTRECRHASMLQRAARRDLSPGSLRALSGLSPGSLRARPGVTESLRAAPWRVAAPVRFEAGLLRAWPSGLGCPGPADLGASDGLRLTHTLAARAHTKAR